MASRRGFLLLYLLSPGVKFYNFSFSLMRNYIIITEEEEEEELYSERFI